MCCGHVCSQLTYRACALGCEPDKIIAYTIGLSVCYYGNADSPYKNQASILDCLGTARPLEVLGAQSSRRVVSLLFCRDSANDSK